MANQFVNLPVPVGNGVGTPVDVSTFGASKSIVVGGNAIAQITIEINNDPGQAGSWSALKTFQNTGEIVVDVACWWMRVRVSAYNQYAGGTPNVDVGGDDAGTLFAALVAPAGNGAGASVDVSALGIFKTVQVGGPYRGMTLVEVSEDGTDWSQPFAFQSQSPGYKSLVITAQFMRVRRNGVPKVDPGLPIVNVGACEEGGGGGGGGGGGSNCLIYRPGSGEEGPVVFDDWADLYAELQTLRAAANSSGCYTIMFDDTVTTPASVPAGTYDMTNVTWEGMAEAPRSNSHVDVELVDGVVLQHLRKLTSFLNIRSISEAAVITDLGVDGSDTFWIGTTVILGTETAPLIDVANGQGLVTIYLDDEASIINAGVPVVHVSGDEQEVRFELVGSRSSVVTDTVSSVVGSTVTFDIGSSAILAAEELQPSLAGTFNKENSTRLRLNPTPQPPVGPYTADTVIDDSNQLVLVDPSGADDPNTVTMTLPPAFDRRGQYIVVKNVSNSTNQIIVTADAVAGDTVDGAASITIDTAFGFVQLVSDGVNEWRPVGVDDTDTDTVTGSNCLIYRPGSGSVGPVVFDLWADLYIALQSMRNSGNGDGCYTIMIDATDDSPATIPAGTYDMKNVTWEGIGALGNPSDVDLVEGVVLENLRRITNYLQVNFAGNTAPITDLGVAFAETFYLGLGCSLRSNTDPMIVFADEASGSTIEMDDHASLVGGQPVVATDNTVNDLRFNLIGADSAIQADSLEAAAGTTITTYIQDDSSQVDETQTNLDVAATLAVVNTTRLRIDPTPQPPLAPYTANDTISDGNQLVLVDPSVAEDPNTVTMTLPPAFNRRGQYVIVKNVTSSLNQIIIAADGTDTIDGAANYTIEAAFGFVTLISDGVDTWRQVGVDDTDTDTSRSFIPEQWAAEGAIAASDTNVGMKSQLSTNFDTFVMLRAGSITGLVWRLNGGPITAGTLTVTVRINGATVAVIGVSTSVSNPNGGRQTVATGVVPYVAGDLVDVQYTCDAGLLPTAAMNLEATVEITQ
jgi:hypothetical protein